MQFHRKCCDLAKIYQDHMSVINIACQNFRLFPKIDSNTYIRGKKLGIVVCMVK